MKKGLRKRFCIDYITSSNPPLGPPNLYHLDDKTEITFSDTALLPLPAREGGGGVSSLKNEVRSEEIKEDEKETADWKAYHDDGENSTEVRY